MAAPTVVVFLGGMGGSPIEEMMGRALRAAALDSLEAALGTGAFAGAVLVTDDPSLANDVGPGVMVDVDRPSTGSGPGFHFGRRLREVIERYGIERVLYFGAGAVPLLTADEFAALAAQLSRSERAVIANNFFSGDLVGFVPAGALTTIEPPASDNALPRLLRDAGLDNQLLPRTTATQLNLDSPGDLAILALQGGGGLRLSRLVQSLCLDLSNYRRCLPYLTDPAAEVVVAGRMGSQVWQYLERETACRVRVFSEERGMQAAGRHLTGEARSMLGYHLEAVGMVRFFEELATLGDAAFIDTRVLLAHPSLRSGQDPPSRADRFLSDLGRFEEIEDPFLHQFTEAATGAPVPVVLGGHSLVSGGLMALIEAAWREHDRAVDAR